MLVIVYAEIWSIIVVFYLNPPTAILKLPNFLSHEWLTFLKRCYWFVGQEYNKHVTEPGQNQNKNIDNVLRVLYSGTKINIFSNTVFGTCCCCDPALVWKLNKIQKNKIKL